MSRSLPLRNLAHTLWIARYCQKHNISTSEGMERIAALEAIKSARRRSRREFLVDMGKLAVVGTTLGVGSGQVHPTIAAPAAVAMNVAIVGAGLAGLACGYELKQKGINATLYEASNRLGGRCYSLGGAFPGSVTFPSQVVERGGEFIDNLHKTLLGYVREFKLDVEDLSKQPGEVSYYFNGQRYTESVVVDEFRKFVAAMRDDLRSLSVEPTADNYTEADRKLDLTTLQQYLDTRGAGNLIKAVIKAAYVGEYGLEIDRQSCLNFLLFIHADKRSKFRPFGVFSDERYHVIGGNQQIVEGLRSRLQGQIQVGKKLVAARKDSAGKVELTFNDGSSGKFDAVVFAIPFSTLREVDLHASLELPAEKRFAINNLVYGTNAKLMVGFTSRPWAALGSNGSSYADLPHLQSTWETNPSNATSNRAVLTDYISGNLGAKLNPNQVQQETSDFLNDLNRIFPGASAAARRNGNQVVAHLEHWPSNPLVKGSYTCNQPGYFTSIANNEGKPVGNLYFAGEHANSFYDWQGFLEGAAISGIDAAKQILSRVKGNPS
jgi:monoamine oxidase